MFFAGRSLGHNQGRIHGERHFRNHLNTEFGPLTGIDKVYFSDNPENIYDKTMTTAAK